MLTHHMASLVPVVKIPHHRDSFSIGGPYAKMHAFNAINLAPVGTEKAIGLFATPLAKKV